MSKKINSEKINPKTGLPLLDEENELSFRPRHGLIYRVIFWPVSGLVRIIFPAKVYGRENLPREGGMVLAFNHICSLDPAIVTVAARRKLFFLAKVELARGWKGKILKSWGIIPVDRARRNSTALNLAIQVLKQGGIIAIAPEGHTNRKAELAPFKFGAVAMAGRARVPIVPVVIVGRYLPFRKKLSITYGKPVMVDANDLKNANEKLWYTINSMREKTKEGM
ncbi:1-acyl-sn-glycerol-3-phosphate acyltransferase [Candidatus Saccharibacteria bacterium]|nr:1-acyl-sn-glycerol-3-phosphate acyltransferase [Candidatus Saccharibacteria bacterium]